MMILCNDKLSLKEEFKNYSMILVIIMILAMLQQDRHSSWWTFCRCRSLLFHFITKNRWLLMCKVYPGEFSEDEKLEPVELTQSASFSLNLNH